MFGARRPCGARRAAVGLVLAGLAGLAVVPGVPARAAVQAPDVVLTIETGSHGPLPQAARITYRIRVRNEGSADLSDVMVAQELPRGVAPLGAPVVTGGDAACLVLGSQGPDGATRYLASCDVGAVAAQHAVVMVVRGRVDRGTCGDLPTSARATVDGVGATDATRIDRVACACGVRLDREVLTPSPAVGSAVIIRTSIGNPGPHPLRFELLAHGRRVAAGVLPGGASRRIREVVDLRDRRIRDEVRVVASAPDGRSCGARAAVVVRAAASPTDGHRDPGDGATAFTGPSGTVPWVGALACLLVGLAALFAGRRRRT